MRCTSHNSDAMTRQAGMIIYTQVDFKTKREEKCLASVLKFPLRGSVSLCLYIQATASRDYFSVEDKSHIRFVNRIVK